MNNNTDLRVIKTKKAIKSAFLNLLEEKSYESITIQDLSKEAMINRNTFYLHYRDKEDLMEKIIDECSENLMNALHSINIKLDSFIDEDLHKIINCIFRTIENDFDLYKTIMLNNGTQNFKINLSKILYNHINSGFKDSFSKEKKVYLEYIVSGFVGTVYFWINNKSDYSIQEISKILFNIHIKNIHLLINSNNKNL